MAAALPTQSWGYTQTVTAAPNLPVMTWAPNRTACEAFKALQTARDNMDGWIGNLVTRTDCRPLTVESNGEWWGYVYLRSPGFGRATTGPLCATLWKLEKQPVSACAPVGVSYQ
jgi:hypothetical protein